MTDARERIALTIAGDGAGVPFGIVVAAAKADRVLDALRLTPEAATALMDGTAVVVPVEAPIHWIHNYKDSYLDQDDYTAMLEYSPYRSNSDE